MILSAQSLTKRYGPAPAHEAVRGASLELREGEFVSIVGRSGSGKSTLMAMLGALIRPSEGTLLLDGTDAWTLPETSLADLRCRNIGFVFQFPSLLSNLSAVDNVALPALLGGTLDAKAAYARAYGLLARIGLAHRAEARPDVMSGGEQRRVTIARALINSPRLLLADEPTGDLDEESEAEIIDFLQELRHTQSFGLALVTHNVELARRAARTYEMRQGALAAKDLAGTPITSERHGRRANTEETRPCPEPAARPAAAPASIGLGKNLWRGVQTALLASVISLAGIMLLDLGIGKYQARQTQERLARAAALQHLALNSVRSDVQSITDLGNGRYALATYLENVGGGQSIYVLSPDLRAYVQVGNIWQELSMRPTDENTGRVLKIEGKQVYHYVFDAHIKDFAQLLPNYMHVRFSGTMLVSGSSAIPNDDVFERKDNYYVYLKPFDVADDIVLKRMRFSGKPPVWIPMPPH